MSDKKLQMVLTLSAFFILVVEEEAEAKNKEKPHQIAEIRDTTSTCSRDFICVEIN